MPTHAQAGLTELSSDTLDDIEISLILKAYHADPSSSKDWAKEVADSDVSDLARYKGTNVGFGIFIELAIGLREERTAKASKRNTAESNAPEKLPVSAKSSKAEASGPTQADVENALILNVRRGVSLNDGFTALVNLGSGGLDHLDSILATLQSRSKEARMGADAMAEKERASESIVDKGYLSKQVNIPESESTTQVDEDNSDAAAEKESERFAEEMLPDLGDIRTMLEAVSDVITITQEHYEGGVFSFRRLVTGTPAQLRLLGYGG